MEAVAILGGITVAVIVLVVIMAKRKGRLEVRHEVAKINRDKEERKNELDKAMPSDVDDFWAGLRDEGVSGSDDLPGGSK